MKDDGKDHAVRILDEGNYFPTSTSPLQDLVRTHDDQRCKSRPPQLTY